MPSIPVAEDLIYREMKCLEDVLTTFIYLNSPPDHTNIVFSHTLTVYSEQIQAWDRGQWLGDEPVCLTFLLLHAHHTLT